MPKGSGKTYQLTAQGLQKLEVALKVHGDRPSDLQVAGEYGLDRGTVSKIRLGKENVNRKSIEQLFTALDLDLEEEDYLCGEISPHRGDPSKSLPNPFQGADLWGCDEQVRRIFEGLRKGGSWALVGPNGCGKTEILRAIRQRGPELLDRSPETFLAIDMHLIRDESAFFEELSDKLRFSTTDPNQIRRQLHRQGKPHVLCLDAIHVLTDETFFPEATRTWLRGMAEIENSPLQLVVTSQNDLRNLFPDNPKWTSPLADFFAGQTIALNPWTLNQMEQFLAERLQGAGVRFDRPEIQDIWDASAGKPKIVQERARDLYDRKVGG